jgi:ATP-dependent Clp protease adaptor protein ClpS
MGTHNGASAVNASRTCDGRLRRTADELFRSIELFAGPGPGGPQGPREPGQAPDEGEDVDLEDKPVTSQPRRYKVIFHNDDYTTQEFVVFVLKQFFHKPDAEARHIMLTVHFKGAAVAGVYTKDVAETKAQQVMDLAREQGMPLLLTTEPE